MEHICPICNKITKADIEPSDKVNVKDYVCRNSVDTHFYVCRIVDEIITQLKVRFNDDKGTPLFFKILYDKKRTEIWTEVNGNKVQLDKILTPNFSDLDKLRDKLKLYLLVS